jgi:hypothetical protein
VAFTSNNAGSSATASWFIIHVSTGLCPGNSVSRTPSRARSQSGSPVFSGSNDSVAPSGAWAGSAPLASGRFPPSGAVAASAAPPDSDTRLRPSAPGALNAIACTALLHPSCQFTARDFIPTAASTLALVTPNLSNAPDAAGGISVAVFVGIGVAAFCAIAAVSLIVALASRRSRQSSTYEVCTTDATTSPAAPPERIDSLTFLNPCCSLLTEALGETLEWDETIVE